MHAGRSTILICQALCEALGLHQETKLVKIQALGEPAFQGRGTNNGGFSDSHFEAIWRPDLKTHQLQNLDRAGVEVQINPRMLISQSSAKNDGGHFETVLQSPKHLTSATSSHWELRHIV